MKLARIHDLKGWVSIDDVRALIKEIGVACNPNSMLQQEYRCTGEAIEPGSRKCKWVRRRYAVSAVERFVEVSKMIRE